MTLEQSPEHTFSVTMAVNVTNVPIVTFATMVTKVTNIFIGCIGYAKAPGVFQTTEISCLVSYIKHTASYILPDVLSDSEKRL
jgi:hypothetical protein